MWLILTCGFDGCGTGEVELARAGGWRAEAAIVGFADPDFPSWRQQWFPIGFERLAEDARFASQRECLRALRRALPEGEERTGYAGRWELGWEVENVTHHPDFVGVFQAVGREEGRASMMRTYYHACFQEAPRVG